MNNSNGKPILVTGSHRSGSSWTGRTIAFSRDIAYLSEPFNLGHRPGICRARFDYWFPYVCTENERLYLSELRDCLRFKYNLAEEFGVARSLKDLLRLVRDYSRFRRYSILKKRPLLKDPIAIFSAEWLATRFDMDVVVLIRHPAAFVGSIKAAKWTFPFDHFLRQPLLMQHHLADFRPQIEEFSRTDKGVIEQAALLWNLIHYMILKYRESHPGWIFVKHEELSENPVREFARLYERLGIGFSRRIQHKIRKSTTSEPRKIKLDTFERDSKSNIWSWKKRLTEEEIAKIRERTREIAAAFYTEKDWAHSVGPDESLVKARRGNPISAQ